MDVVTYALLKNKINEIVNSNLYDDTEIQNKISEIQSDLLILLGSGDGSISKQISNEIFALVDGAPETMDTFKEISDWIDKHGDVVKGITTNVQDNTDNINKLQSSIDTKLDKFGYTSDKYLGTDENGCVVEKDTPSYTGTPTISEDGILIFAPDVAAIVNSNGVLII